MPRVSWRSAAPYDSGVSAPSFADDLQELVGHFMSLQGQMKELLPHIERVLNLIKSAKTAAPLTFPVEEDVVSRVDRATRRAFKDFAECEEGRGVA